MILRVILVLTVLSTAVTSGFAQADASNEYPYTGELTATRVYVRCGPGEASGRNNYYQCTVLNKPDRVTVVGSKNGWLRVLPPKGCYSVIAADYVENGIVTGNRVWVRPAGTLRKANFNLGQIRLDKGDKVKVIGSITADGRKWHTIESPKNTYYWIFAKFVQKVQTTAVVDNAEDAAEALEGTPDKETVDTTTAQPEDITTPSDSTKIDPMAGKVDADTLKAFRDLQKQMLAEYKKPVSLRDLQGLVEKFQKFPVKEKSPLEPFIKYYVSYIQADINRVKGLSQADMMMRETAEKQQKYDLQRATQEIRSIEKSVVYTTSGILGQSQLFSGKVTGIKRYLVFDVATRKINAYVEADPSLGIDKFIGQYVGIYGTTRYDKSLAVEIITASQIVVLKKQAVLPTPPQPIVKPLPKPAYKPTGKLAGSVITVKPEPTTKPSDTEPVESVEELAAPKAAAEEKKTPAITVEPDEEQPQPEAETKPADEAVKPVAEEKPEEKPVTVAEIEKQITARAIPADAKKNEATVEAAKTVIEPSAPIVPVKAETLEVKPPQDIESAPLELPAVETPKVEIVQPAKTEQPQVSPAVETSEITPSAPKVSPQIEDIAIPDQTEVKPSADEKVLSVKIETPTAAPAEVPADVTQPEALAIPEVSPKTDVDPAPATQPTGTITAAPITPTPAVKMSQPAIKPQVKATVNPQSVKIDDIKTKSYTAVKKVTSTQPAAKPTTQPAGKATTRPAVKPKNITAGIIEPLPLEKAAPAIEAIEPEALDIPDIEAAGSKPLPPAGLPLATQKSESGVDESEYE